MTTIIANLKDSKGSPLAGTLRIKLDYLLVDDDSSSAYLPVAATIPLSNGSATVVLEPSESARVTYLFEIVQTSTVTNADGTTTTVESIIWAFRAKVPDSATAVQLTDLIQTTGITNDALDSSLTAVVRRLYNSGDFWARLKSEIFVHRGTFSYTTWYKAGDVVNFQGSGYLYVNTLASSGTVPTNTTYWKLLASIGNTGAGTSGNDAVYDPTGWDNATDAPSRNAVRDIVETLATKTELNTKVGSTDATLTRPRLAADPTASDRSSLIVSSQWVQTLVDTIKKALVPVGTISTFAGSSAPNGWVLCDGRTLSRTTYSALFAVLGIAFNTGGEAATDFRLPDLRGRVVVGMDSMSALQGSANRVVGAWADALGGNFGAETHTLTVDEIPSHSHTSPTAGTTILISSATATAQSLTGAGGTAVAYASGTANTGSGATHNNIQPSIALTAIIYTGI